MKRRSWVASMALGLVPPVQSTLASGCSFVTIDDGRVACVDGYAAVMEPPFNRTLAETLDTQPLDSFRRTNVSDSSFDLVRNATFIVFDKTRGAEILGDHPQLDLVFQTSAAIHEAPVWIPWLNAIIFSVLSEGVYGQRLINLTGPSPTMHNYTTTPPVYAVSGGRLFHGSVYWAVAGGGALLDPANPSRTVYQSPGIYKLNPNTTEVQVLLNNYFGTPMNSPDDLFVDPRGDVFFTDPPYGYALGVTTTPPALPPATYRLRPSTGQVSVVDTSIAGPNGIVFSPDNRVAYISSTARVGVSVVHTGSDSVPKVQYDHNGDHAVYAFDLVDSPTGKYMINKRPFWLAEDAYEDGIHVSIEGYVVGAAGNGVDVLSPHGELLVRVTVPEHTVNNVQFVNLGSGGSELWMFGQGGISKVTWNLQGVVV